MKPASCRERHCSTCSPATTRTRRQLAGRLQPAARRNGGLKHALRAASAPLQCAPAPRGALHASGARMKVLVIGSGGREHALAWKLKQSPRVSEVIVAPGNAGTARERGVRNAEVAMNDLDGLLRLARAEKIELTVVG